MTTTLRAMTVNLWSDRVHPAGLGRVLDEVAPHVLTVQELEAHAVATIAARFPHHFLDPATDALGSGVASRIPMEAARLAMPHRDGWLLTLTPPGWHRPLQIVTVHLMNPIRWPWLESIRIRRRQVDAVETVLRAASGPFLLMGDLNATPMWPAYRRLADIGLDDGARLTGTAAGTWRYRAFGPPVLRIDHVLSRGVTVVATFTAVVPGSDHLGVVVDIAAPDRVLSP